MAAPRSFIRSRALKLVIAFCAMSALAFLLGQGAAAFRGALAQALVQTPNHAAPQVVERVVGAQGTAPASPAQPASQSAPAGAAGAVALTTYPSHAASADHAQADARASHEKDKKHGKHKRAAGDTSHGGPSHDDGGGHGEHGGGHGGGHGG
ncbi:MAG TPA: hypothetical protein VID72_00765 [Ktedonobacterales bacterium]